MPRLTKITTRRGDDGRTDLADGTRVEKDSPRLRAIGALDELNAALGLAVSFAPQAETAEALHTVQQELFQLGAALACPIAPAEAAQTPSFTDTVRRMEDTIQALAEALGPLENFILPGGCRAAAALHLARTICRRAEQDLVALGRTEPVEPGLWVYLNRLSDLLFQFARRENKAAGVVENGLGNSPLT
jgi:cob(I)alamin adenosyltransferase